jgi:chromosome segregation ATPase
MQQTDAGATPLTVVETTAGLPGAQATTPIVTVEDLQAQIDKLQGSLKERNKEEQARRKRVDELEAELKRRQEAEMTEAERMQAKLKELEPQAQKATEYEAVIAELLDTRLKALIPEARKAVEDLPGDALTRLQWLARNLDGGQGGGEREKDRPIQLTEVQLKAARNMNVTPEAYAARLKELAEREKLRVGV